MEKLLDNPKFERFLEIVPGFLSWSFILSPLVLAFVWPEFLGLFLLVYVFYYFVKAMNIARHLVFGYRRLKRNIAIDWLKRCQQTTDLSGLQRELLKNYKKFKNRLNWEDLLVAENLNNAQANVKNWKEIYHVVLFAVSTERLDIIDPAIASLSDCNYPKKKIIVVLAAEARYKKTFLKDVKVLEKKYKNTFYDFRWYLHTEKQGEVRGKGANITNAGHLFWEDYKKSKIKPENILVTNLDADHVVHREYFGRLTYLYVLDPSRDHKTYQPVPLLFNNIWDVAIPNRVSATGSSFWQIVESMRPFRQRTFAAHTQSLAMLLVTDFWSTQTIVEDGHQYWRTLFAYNGNHAMVPLFVPVYQDAVYGETYWLAFKNQYLQMRRWGWGVSDFPFVVKNLIRHKEMPLLDRMVLLWRLFTGYFSWSTYSIMLSLGWIPLNFNYKFQDTVLAHNIMIYNSNMLRIAWIGIIANVWISLSLLPPRPARWGRKRYFDMVIQWVFAPIVSIFLSSIPALESQTRLLLGKKLEFWITPKKRLKD